MLPSVNQHEDVLPAAASAAKAGNEACCSGIDGFADEAARLLTVRAMSRADVRDRTGNLRFTRAMLYQLSYVGDGAYES